MASLAAVVLARFRDDVDGVARGQLPFDFQRFFRIFIHWLAIDKNKLHAGTLVRAILSP